MTLNIWLQSPGLCGQESPREHNFRKYYLLLVCLFAAVANFEKLECSSPKDPCIAPISRTIISFFLIIKPSKIKTSNHGGEIKTYFTATRRVPGSAGEMSPFSFSEDSLRFLRKHLLSFPPFIFSALSTFAHFYHLLHGGSSVSVENIPNISASIKDSFCPLPFLVSLPGPFFSLFLLSHGVPSW